MTVLPLAPSAPINRMRQGMHGGRLIVAGNDDRSALVRLKVFDDCGNEPLRLRIEIAGRSATCALRPQRSRRATASTSDARTG